MVAVRKTRGGVLLVEEREWFARLVAQGVSNAEACRIVGINRKTGIRWRYGRTIRNTAGEAVHYLPVRVHSAYGASSSISVTGRVSMAKWRYPVLARYKEPGRDDGSDGLG